MNIAIRFVAWVMLLRMSVCPTAAADAIETRWQRHHELATAAIAAGNYEVARTNLLAAHALVVPEGFNRDRYRYSLESLALFYYARGKPYLSRKYVTTLRDHYGSRGSTNRVAAAHACFLFSQVQRELHKFEPAEKSLLEALAIAEKELGKDSLTAAHMKARLGQLYVWMKQDAKAIEFLEPGLRGIVTGGWVPRAGAEPELSLRAFHQPNDLVAAQLTLEHVLALNAVGRKAEGAAKLKVAERLFSQTDSKTSPKFQVLKQAGHTLEARGDWRAAEDHFYAAAAELWRDEKLSQREKLRGNELVLEFHVRQGQDAQASTIEGVLYGAGISEDYLHELNLRCERLSYARDGGPHKKN